MSGRRIAAFVIGFLAGALSIYYLLWRTGSLVPGRAFTLTTKELVSGIPPTPRPVPTIPLATPTIADSHTAGPSPSPTPDPATGPAPPATPEAAKD
jgi:hypothetical protein